MAEISFPLKQHHKFLSILIASARETGKCRFNVPLKQMAQIYDFTNLLKDEEEMEYVLDDITMELMEMAVEDQDGNIIENCGIERLDYMGGKNDLKARIKPELKTVTSFRLVMVEYVDE